MNEGNQNHQAILRHIAHRAMLERNLLPDFSTEILDELEYIQNPLENISGVKIRDLRD